MQTDRLIKECIEVKINYRSIVDAKTHYLRGTIIKENQISLFVKGFRRGDIFAILKKNIVSMTFEKPEDQPKPEIKVDPVIKRHSEKKETFSYSNLWKVDHIQEVRE